MKFRIFSPRAFVRAVRALESIATSLSDIRNEQYRVNGRSGVVTPTDDDTDDDDTISYTNDRDTWEQQQRAKQRAADGFPEDRDQLPPRN